MRPAATTRRRDTIILAAEVAAIDREEFEPSRPTGRPTRDRSAQLGDAIIDAATELFLADGYGATSIEAVARRARISKRTFYARFPDKAALFRAVVDSVVARLRPPETEQLFEPGPIEQVLFGVAVALLDAALNPLALALYRVTLAESGRFADVAHAATGERGSAEAVERIATVLAMADPSSDVSIREFAASQFLHMVIAIPQRRALGLGHAMSEGERTEWARATVALFLNGWRATLQRGM
jgi:AcrR family transcriptional regulator